jgi:hypothetical protein
VIIDWGNKIINVFKTDMLEIQQVPTEIWELDLPNFKASLGNLLDDEYGMVYPAIFNHNPAVSVGGVTLAKVIEIINGYTITFEDGQYAVNLVNANSNVGDMVNVNQVSVRSANSAGLTNVREIQFSTFQGVVTLDADNGFSGTAFPIGTHAKPSNNFEDTTFIADLRGIETILLQGTHSLTSNTDLKGRIYKGENPITTFLSVTSNVIVDNVQFEDVFISNSTFGGSTYFKHVFLVNTYGISGFIEGCVLTQNIGISNRANSYFIDCKSACVGLGTIDLPILDMSNGTHHTAFRNWSGPIKIINSDDANNTICIDVGSGATIILEPSCTAGQIIIRGIATIINRGTMDIVTDTLVNVKSISDTVWESTKGDTIYQRSIGGFRKNYTLNQIIMLNEDGTDGVTYNCFDRFNIPSLTSVDRMEKV